MIGSFKIKHHFIRAFRELFVHHHGSLEFRSKIFALLISVNDKINENVYDIVYNYGLKLYNNEERAQLLKLTTQELVKKVRDDNGLNDDKLIINIQKELRVIPRYAKKIDVRILEPILEFTHNPDILDYQRHILEFLETIKVETLRTKKNQIEFEEQTLNK